MKPGLGSPDFLFTSDVSVSLSEGQLTILLSISKTAISDILKKSNVFIKSSMILRIFNASLKFSYKTMLFNCSGAFSPKFHHCYSKMRGTS